MSLADVMSKSVIALDIDDDLSKAKSVFEKHRIHHILIKDDDGILVGVINDRDLYKHLSPNIGTKKESARDTTLLSKKVHQIMNRELVTASPDISLNDAVLLFHDHHISCLPVTGDDKKVLGILTWRDIIKLVARQYKMKQLKQKQLQAKQSAN